MSSASHASAANDEVAVRFEDGSFVAYLDERQAAEANDRARRLLRALLHERQSSLADRLQRAREEGIPVGPLQVGAPILKTEPWIREDGLALKTEPGVVRLDLLDPRVWPATLELVVESPPWRPPTAPPQVVEGPPRPPAEDELRASSSSPPSPSELEDYTPGVLDASRYADGTWTLWITLEGPAALPDVKLLTRELVALLSAQPLPSRIAREGRGDACAYLLHERFGVYAGVPFSMSAEDASRLAPRLRSICDRVAAGAEEALAQAEADGLLRERVDLEPLLRDRAQVEERMWSRWWGDSEPVGAIPARVFDLPDVDGRRIRVRRHVGLLVVVVLVAASDCQYRPLSSSLGRWLATVVEEGDVRGSLSLRAPEPEPMIEAEPAACSQGEDSVPWWEAAEAEDPASGPSSPMSDEDHSWLGESS